MIIYIYHKEEDYILSHKILNSSMQYSASHGLIQDWFGNLKLNNTLQLLATFQYLAQILIFFVPYFIEHDPMVTLLLNM